jgi:hypothetical protein
MGGAFLLSSGAFAASLCRSRSSSRRCGIVIGVVEEAPSESACKAIAASDDRTDHGPTTHRSAQQAQPPRQAKASLSSATSQEPSQAYRPRQAKSQSLSPRNKPSRAYRPRQAKSQAKPIVRDKPRVGFDGSGVDSRQQAVSRGIKRKSTSHCGVVGLKLSVKRHWLLNFLNTRYEARLAARCMRHPITACGRSGV